MAATGSLTASTSDATNLTTYTFTGQSVGTAAADRKVVVVVESRITAASASISSLTVAGNAATRDHTLTRTDAGATNIVEVWEYALTTGTTATIAVTFGASMLRCAIQVYAVYGADTAAFATAGQALSSGAPSTTINVPAGGFLIAGAVEAAATTTTWTGPTEDVDAQVEGNTTVSSASAAYASTQTGLTVTATFASSPASSSPTMIVVSWGPAAAPTFKAYWITQAAKILGGGVRLMYPRNAASPPRISVGAVVQISDGAVQTSGVSIAVVPQGGASGAGGGTTAYDNGIVLYTPTQAETNYTAFLVTAYKTGCIPVSVTVVTTASAVSGYAGLDWSVINAPTTSVSLSGTTISTSQAVASVSGSVASVTGDLGGKVIGGGAGTITGTGVRAVDGSGNAIAPASTALSTATWTNTRAGYLDNLSGGAVALASTALSTANWTNTRAGYLDNLSAGPVAQAATALSTTQWTNGRAANLDNLDATVSSRLAPTVAGRTLDITTGGAAGIDWGNVENQTTAVGLTGTTISTAGLVAAVWDSTISGHTTTGTFGGTLNAAGSAGDPWSTALPGAYAAGSAGYIVGTNLNATVSSRLAAASAPANWTQMSISGTGVVDSNVVAVGDISVEPADYVPAQLTTQGLADAADAVLGRNIAGGSIGGRTVSSALYVLRNKIDTQSTPGTMLVYGTDDTTLAWQATLTTNVSAAAVTVSDPTS